MDIYIIEVYRLLHSSRSLTDATYSYNLRAKPELVIDASRRSLNNCKTCFECNNRLRLWIISFSFSSMKYFLVRCLLDFETSLRFDERVMLP